MEEKDILKGLVYCCFAAGFFCDDDCPYKGVKNCSSKLHEDGKKLFEMKEKETKNMTDGTGNEEKGTMIFALEHDPVNHPSYYTTGKIECIDFITDTKLNFCRGNAVKYIVRAGLKDKGKEIEDLEKAIFYINREIEELKKEMIG